MAKIEIGYWNDARNRFPEYPLPIANPKRDVSKELAALNKIFSKATKMFYKGWSTCRICSAAIGSAEYEIKFKGNIYVIPEGYAHYVEHHFIKVDPIVFEIARSI